MRGYIMPRIEILFDKENSNKPSEKVRNALREQVIHKIGNKYGPLNVRVALSSSTSLVVTGAKSDDATKEINEIIENIWLDDSWVPAWKMTAEKVISRLFLESQK
ncbi:DinI-like family protein [Providencia rettgeri]|nr:DinI-like family protein [Providencia rettgeri]